MSKATESALADVIPFNEKIIIAHFNGNPTTSLANKIKSIPKHNHEIANSYGKLLLDLTEENDPIITNTTFQKRSGKLWTSLSDMNGKKSQIDYILINRKWKNSVKNVEARSTFFQQGLRSPCSNCLTKTMVMYY